MDCIVHVDYDVEYVVHVGYIVHVGSIVHVEYIVHMVRVDYILHNRSWESATSGKCFPFMHLQ